MGAGYLEQRGPFAIIFGSFACVMLPLLALRTFPNSLTLGPYLEMFEVTLLGTGHFFLTLALYAQSSHLDHFNSGWRNRLVFFIVPAVILLGTAAMAASGLQPRGWGLYLFAAIRFADFLHVGRQSYGMLQLFKRPLRDAAPVALRMTENAFFVAMAMLQWLTYTSGGQLPLHFRWVQLCVALLGAAALAITGGYLRVLVRDSDARALRALGYFGMQAFASSIAAYRTELYVIALTLHYTEYYVIMAPRCFATPLDTTRRVDRIFGALRARRWVLLGLVGLVAVLFTLRGYAAVNAGVPLRFFIFLFDGIFLAHYFAEAFLWRFRDPFWKATLGSLYFGTPAATPAVARERRWNVPVRCAIGAVIAIVLLWPLGLGGYLASNALVDPIHAKNHRRWGLEAAYRGDPVAAEHHLELAVRTLPEDRMLQRALQWARAQRAPRIQVALDHAP